MAGSCPNAHDGCAVFLEQAEELSPRLAGRIRDVYCNDDYVHCARYHALKRSKRPISNSIRPWDLGP